MGTPFTLYDATQQQDPTAELENSAAAGQNSLATALLNGQQQQQTPQQPAQQTVQPQQQQPTVKGGLRNVLFGIMRNIGVAGLPGAAYPGDILGEAHQR